MTNFVQKFKGLWAPEEDYYEEEYDERNAEERSSENKERSNEDKVVNFNKTVRSKIKLIKPEKYGDGITDIAKEFLKRTTIILNLEKMSRADTVRTTDFLSGAAYAQKGDMKRISADVVILTPCDVEFDGEDILNELEKHGIYF